MFKGYVEFSRYNTLTVTKAAGIRPRRVAKKKVWYGTLTIGDAKLINVFGNAGVSLRKSM